MGIIAIILLVCAAITLYQAARIEKWGAAGPALVENIGDSFLELQPELKRAALDLAWSRTHTALMSAPVTLGALAFWRVVGLFIACLFIVLAVLLAVAGLSPQKSNNIVPLLLALLLAGGAVYLLNAAAQIKKILPQVTEYELKRAMAASRLRSLGSDFVSREVRTWLKAVQKSSLEQASRSLKADTSSTFTLWSSDIQRNGMPPARIGMTLFFSSTFLSVVSGIEVDIRNTSYDVTVDPRAIPTVTPASAWTEEEFHYMDVVHVAYDPRSATDAQRHKEFGIDTASVDDHVAGNLKVTLSSGTVKSYPSTREDSISLQAVIRDRVRSTKQEANPKAPASTDNENKVHANQYCTQCGAAAEKHFRFCGACGHELSAQSEAGVE